MHASRQKKDQSQDKRTGDVPEGAELAEPGEPADGEAVDEAMQDEDEAVDGQHDVFGRKVAAAVGPAGAEQDDHLDELRQREVHARRTSSLHDRDGQHRRLDRVSYAANILQGNILVVLFEV